MNLHSYGVVVHTGYKYDVLAEIKVIQRHPQALQLILPEL